MKNININLPNKHLVKRYFEIVKAHCQHAPSIAAGPAIPADAASSFAATQGTWRFFANEKVTPQALVEPLRDFARQQIAEGTQYVLSVIDWSKIDYRHHTSKPDIVQLTHDTDIGYELTTQLLVNAETGQPIAPIQMHLKTANGYLTTSENSVSDEHKLEQLTPLMDESREMNFSATLVHIIDREADAVRLYRQWCEKGHLFLVRGDDRRVSWEGKSLLISEVETKIDLQGAFKKTREVTIKGKTGVQYVAQTSVILDQPASHTVNGKRKMVPGEAISLRLVISRVYDAQTNELLSTWYLLTNAPAEISASQIALWYYWRWHIESYFKLMKSGGQEMEHWQQESGLAILKRLLVASMATATVWLIQGLQGAEATEFKRILTRLSGKSVKRGQPVTAGVLLSGLFVYLRMFDFLEDLKFDLALLKQIQSRFKKFTPALAG